MSSSTPTRKYSAGSGPRPGFHRQVRARAIPITMDITMDNTMNTTVDMATKYMTMKTPPQGTASPVGYGERVDMARRMSGSGNMLFPTGMGRRASFSDY